ncbi:hypothetical protein ACSMXN_18440 [Jatrophihabitans sp. DSM 45814]
MKQTKTRIMAYSGKPMRATRARIADDGARHRKQEAERVSALNAKFQKRLKPTTNPNNQCEKEEGQTP